MAKSHKHLPPQRTTKALSGDSAASTSVHYGNSHDGHAWRRRTVLKAGALSLVAGCSTGPSRSVIDAALSGDPERIVRTVAREELGRHRLPTRVEDLPALFRSLARLLRETWGEREPEVASPRRYVKYSNDYEARAIVDFEQARCAGG